MTSDHHCRHDQQHHCSLHHQSHGSHHKRHRLQLHHSSRCRGPALVAVVALWVAVACFTVPTASPSPATGDMSLLTMQRIKSYVDDTCTLDPHCQWTWDPLPNGLRNVSSDEALAEMPNDYLFPPGKDAEKPGQRGHTRLECDADHARIERAKKLSDSEISIPIDWYNFVRHVRDKIPLKVVEMEIDNFKLFSALLSNNFIKRNLDVNKEKVNWLKIAWLKYDKNFGTIQFKTTLDPAALFRILDFKKKATGKTRAGKKSIISSQLVIPQTYNKLNLIDLEKKEEIFLVYYH